MVYKKSACNQALHIILFIIHIHIHTHSYRTDNLESASYGNSSENSTTNSTGMAVTLPAKFLGQFLPDTICFHDVTQQQMYYIFLVSANYIVKLPGCYFVVWDIRCVFFSPIVVCQCSSHLSLDLLQLHYLKISPTGFHYHEKCW